MTQNLPGSANPRGGIEEWAREHTRQWCVLCDQFKDLTRQTVLTRHLLNLELEEHRKSMNMFLRITRLLHAEVADPDFPDRSLAADVAIRLRQLEDLWEMIHNPMADELADKLLQTVFLPQ